MTRRLKAQWEKKNKAYVATIEGRHLYVRCIGGIWTARVDGKQVGTARSKKQAQGLAEGRRKK